MSQLLDSSKILWLSDLANQSKILNSPVDMILRQAAFGRIHVVYKASSRLQVLTQSGKLVASLLELNISDDLITYSSSGYPLSD